MPDRSGTTPLPLPGRGAEPGLLNYRLVVRIEGADATELVSCGAQIEIISLHPGCFAAAAASSLAWIWRWGSPVAAHRADDSCRRSFDLAGGTR